MIKFDFEDDLEDSVVRCTVSTDVCRPHVQEYNVSRGQSKERCSSLKSLSSRRQRALDKSNRIFTNYLLFTQGLWKYLNSDLPLFGHHASCYPFPRCRRPEYFWMGPSRSRCPRWSTVAQLKGPSLRKSCRKDDWRVCSCQSSDSPWWPPTGIMCPLMRDQ